MLVPLATRPKTEVTLMMLPRRAGAMALTACLHPKKAPSRLTDSVSLPRIGGALLERVARQGHGRSVDENVDATKLSENGFECGLPRLLESHIQ